MSDARVPPSSPGSSSMTFSFGPGATSLTAATPLPATGVLLQSAGFVALVLVLLSWSWRSVPSASGAVEKGAS